MRRTAGGLAAAGALLVLAASPASAATPVATWQMDEDSGRVLHDSTGSHDGTIGSDVVLLGSALRFPYIDPKAHVYRPQHLVTVPDGPGLDPGTSDWSMTARFRYVEHFGNMMQKGQAGPGATYVKMEGERGVISCLFRGTEGNNTVNSGRTVNDGRWHVVTCRRNGNDVSLTLDGRTPRHSAGPTGRIENGYRFSIGGKANCDAVHVTCDYWHGDLDRVRISSR